MNRRFRSPGGARRPANREHAGPRLALAAPGRWWPHHRAL